MEALRIWEIIIILSLWESQMTLFKGSLKNWLGTSRRWGIEARRQVWLWWALMRVSLHGEMTWAWSGLTLDPPSPFSPTIAQWQEWLPTSEKLQLKLERGFENCQEILCLICWNYGWIFFQNFWRKINDLCWNEKFGNSIQFFFYFLFKASISQSDNPSISRKNIHPWSS